MPKFIFHQMSAWILIPAVAYLLVAIASKPLELFRSTPSFAEELVVSLIALAVSILITAFWVKKELLFSSFATLVWIAPTMFVIVIVINSSIKNGWEYAVRENLWISQGNEGVGILVGLIPWLNSIGYSVFQSKYRSKLIETVFDRS
jgi:hypothetical protein